MAAPKRPNPPGLKSEKEWRDAIRQAVHELRQAPGEKKGQKAKALRLLARKLVDRAMDGDIAALKEIGDRMDGKPAQALEHSGPGGEPLRPVEVRIVDPRPADTD